MSNVSLQAIMDIVRVGSERNLTKFCYENGGKAIVEEVLIYKREEYLRCYATQRIIVDKLVNYLIIFA
jgi:hypothetical protein